MHIYNRPDKHDKVNTTTADGDWLLLCSVSEFVHTRAHTVNNVIVFVGVIIQIIKNIAIRIMGRHTGVPCCH